jgi:hypothetical protein
MMIVWLRPDTSNRLPLKEHTPMHDILIGLAFVGMVIAPAIVAAFSGSSEASAEN